ncbi:MULTISPECIES: fumarylacetoacetate hydrolase family protein [Rhodococcus]|uniref:Fumarylacetoacetate hydrolase family protein n=1 Tax=Rhodococcus baikonurensis TaxID=172041 RepID=A0ABV5XQU3_9NOCA
MNQAIWRLDLAGTTQLARGDIASGPTELLPPELTIDQLLTRPDGLHKALTTETSGPVPDSATIAAPVENQRIWASGVTFERSRTARKEESTNSDVYDAVYDAERPELFFKALGTEVRGPNDRICVRPDSTWNVPEPELGLVIASTGDIVGYTIGNDVSSRSIEGENPLYLPQAKVYEGSCAIGPALIPITEAPDWNSITISLTITRDGRDIFTDSVPLSRMRRTPGELRNWLLRSVKLPHGAVLLTGTSIVPPDEITLLPGDQSTIAITGLGHLTNTVEILDLPNAFDTKRRVAGQLDADLGTGHTNGSR